MEVQSEVEVEPKPVGIWLGMGIFLMPFIFAWFTLQEGRSSNSKVLSFIWLAFFVIGGNGASNDQTDKEQVVAKQAHVTETKAQVVKVKSHDFIKLSEAVIMNELKSPSSFQRKNAEVKWTGVDEMGHDSAIVKVTYDANNSYGASIRACKFVSYWITSEGGLNWHQNSVFEDCDGVNIDGMQVPPMSIKDLVVVNFYRRANQ